MINIDIKIDKDIDFGSLGTAEIGAIDNAIESLAISTRDKWVALAKENLKSARFEYVRGLQEKNSLKKTGSLEYEVALVGWLPNAVEGGISPFDMKPGLLGGKNAAKHGGKYANVPFRHFTGAQSAERISKAPNYKQDLAKVLKNSGLDKIIKDSKGKALEGKVGVASGTARLGIKKLKPHHKSTIFEGLTRYQKRYNKKTGSQLMTFRRVSRNSDPISWLHPGLPGVHLMKDVEKYIRDQVDLIFKSIAGNI